MGKGFYCYSSRVTRFEARRDRVRLYNQKKMCGQLNRPFVPGKDSLLRAYDPNRMCRREI